MSKQLVIRNKGGEVAEVLVYGVIGDDFFGDGITAKDFRAAIKSVKSKVVNLRINSPGGSVTEGAAMLAVLDEHPARIEVDIDGVAASAASVLAVAGSVVRIASNGLLMIHDPMMMTMGGADDMRRAAALLDTVKGQILDRYERKAAGKTSRQQLVKMMSDETWFDGAQAVAAGLADEVTGALKMTALASHRALVNRLKYRHVPQALTDGAANPYTFKVGDYVQWLVEDPDEMKAELEDGMVEEISEGTLTIPGTSLSLKGSADDPALRICDLDDDESYWYLVRASQVRRVDDEDEDEPTYPGMGQGMEDRADWQETESRKRALANLTQAGGGAAPPPFRAG